MSEHDEAQAEADRLYPMDTHAIPPRRATGNIAFMQGVMWKVHRDAEKEFRGEHDGR